MSSFEEIAAAHTDLDDDALEWLQLLRADWQIIADLSFADLVMWVPDVAGRGFWAIAQQRPTTGPTAYPDDILGNFLKAGRRPLLEEAFRRGTVVREGDPEWRDDVPVRVEAIPVTFDSRVIAVIARHTNLLGVRTPSRLELSYLQTAGELTQMVASGDFPTAHERSDHADTPRVGDGFIRIEAAGQVRYASPNALSVFRRLGLQHDLTGHSLAEVTREIVPARQRPDEEVLSVVLGARAHREAEITTGPATVIVRSVPLVSDGERSGGLILIRDVSELRRRDRELVTKDATIREIHHRVKNNLQTVASLLRLQERRLDDPDAQMALQEAVRRVRSIAIVHETLSQSADEVVHLDEIVDRLSTMVTEVSSVDQQVIVRRHGSFGYLPSEQATTVSMVLTEVLQNAVEHGFGSREPGRIDIYVERSPYLQVRVLDNGQGVPADFDVSETSSLGLSIVHTLVESELGGMLQMGPGPDGSGTQVSWTVPDAVG